LASQEQVRILGISGSLRKASFCTAILKTLARIAAPSTLIDVVTLEEIPLYNEDLDCSPDLPAIAKLKRSVEESDGVLIATPEYNHGIPGVLKNALDWTSRPAFQSCFKDKPVSIISTSRAFTGGVRAQYQLRETLISMHAHLVMGPEVVIGGVHGKVDGSEYYDEGGLSFILQSLERLRSEALARRALVVTHDRIRRLVANVETHSNRTR
jgi:chromate reductase, NAD(P)H dehydrogenase (quinone)